MNSPSIVPIEGTPIGYRIHHEGIVWEWIEKYGVYLWKPIDPQILYWEAQHRYHRQLDSIKKKQKESANAQNNDTAGDTTAYSGPPVSACL